MDTTNTAQTGTTTNDEAQVTGQDTQTDTNPEPTQTEQPTEHKREVTSYEKELRDENKQRRLEAKALREELDTLKTGLATALGIKSEEPADVQATVENVTRERDALSTRISQAERELEVLRTAQRLNIDGDALLDSRRFCDALAKLDTHANDYSDKVAELINASAPKPEAAPRSNTATPGGTKTVTGVDHWRNTLFSRKD